MQQRVLNYLRRFRDRLRRAWTRVRPFRSFRLRCGQTVVGDLRNPTWAKVARRGYHEVATEAFLVENLRRGHVVIDVGAQVGVLTALMSKLVGDDGHVFAFEMDAINCRVLSEVVTRNRAANVSLVCKALGDHCGQVDFVRPYASWGAFAATAAKPGSEDYPALRDEVARCGEAGAYSVEMTTLDAFMADRRLERVDFIKIDVDGMEPEILRGAEKLIRTFRPTVITEISKFVTDRGTTMEEFFSLLLSYDYEIRACDRTKTLSPTILRGPQPWMFDEIARNGAVNLFCIPQRSSVAQP